MPDPATPHPGPAGPAASDAPPPSMRTPGSTWPARAGALALLVVLVATTLAAAHATQTWAHQETDARFQHAARDLEHAIDREILLHFEALRGLRSFIVESVLVERHEWAGYVKALQIGQRHPAIRGVEIALAIPHDRLDAYLATPPDEEYEGFDGPTIAQITPSGERDVHIIVHYVEPLEGNDPGLGVDLASDPVHLEALHRARDTGEPAATGPTPLLRTGEPVQGIHLVLAFYDKAAPQDTVEERRDALQGYALLAVDTDALLSGVLQRTASDLRLTVHDAGPTAATGESAPDEAPRLIFDGSLQGDEPVRDADRYHAALGLDVGGRLWTFSAEPTAVVVSPLEEHAARIVLVAGLAMSLVLAGTVYQLATGRHRALKVAAQRTRAWRQSHDRLEEANRRLTDTEARRAQLMNTIAHEMGSPLTTLKIQFYLLSSAAAKANTAMPPGLAAAERSLNQLERIVDDLKDFARLESGRLRLHPRPVDLAVLLRNATEMHRAAVEQKQVLLEDSLPKTLLVSADPDRLTQVVSNLLNNARKFTGPGGCIRIEAVQEGDEAVVRISDTGRGLSPEEAAQLFQPFTQVHEPAEVAEKGTGLGLFISKGIVEAHGGTVGVQSAGRHHGSTFWLRLPTGTQAPAAAPPVRPQTMRADPPLTRAA